VYILLTSLVGYYGLADLGLGQGIVKFVSENVARGDRRQAARYINVAVFVHFIVGTIMTALFVFFAEGLVVLLRITAAWTDIAVLGIRLCSFGFFFSLLSGTIAAALQGLQRFDITSTIEASMNILLNAAIVSLLLFGYGLKEIIYATTLSSIVIFIIYTVVLRIYFPEWNISFQVTKKEIKELFNFSFFVFFSRASNLFANYIVRYVVAAFAGPAAVTIFVVPLKLLGAIGGVLSSGVNALFPYASEVHAIEPKKIKHLFYKSTRIFSIVSIPVMLFVILYSKQIMSIWMGNTFADQSYIVLSILALSSMIASQSAIPNLIITGMGHSKTLGFLGLIALLCYSIFIPLFTYNYNVIGTAIGMLFSAIISIGFVLVLTTKLVEIDLFPFLRNTFKNHLMPILLMAGVFVCLSWYFHQRTLPLISVGILMTAIHYAYLMTKDKEILQYAKVKWKMYI